MITLPLRHLNRFRQIAGLLYKYGRSDLVKNSGLSEHIGMDENSWEEQENRSSHDWTPAESRNGKHGIFAKSEPTPDELVKDLEDMGPTFIKLGQLLSTRPDFLPERFCAALAKLQDDAEPVESREIFRVIEMELGEQPEYLFAEFEVEPVATASLGQVHRAKMHDGCEVVVKVQRPGVVEQIHEDLEALEEMAKLCEVFQWGREYQLKHLVDSLNHSLVSELDYLNEALNAKTLAKNLAEFESVVVPLPVDSRTTSRVLTMQYVEMEKITELPKKRLSKQRSQELADELFRSFLYQILVHGAFHADPHPGNLGLTSDDRIVLMDFGLVVKVSYRLQTSLLKLLLAICDGDGSSAANIAETAGVPGARFESKEFKQVIERVVAENTNRSVDQLNAGAALMSIQKAAGQHDLLLPQEVILLGRALMHLERVVSALDPHFNPNEAIRQHTMEIMQKNSSKKLTVSSLFQALLETTEFAQRLPERANKFAELLASNQLELKIDAIDENKFIKGLNKVANRITTGLIIAAMIVAASLIMRLETAWTILGYPAIAFCFLLLAAIAGTVLIWKGIVSDRFDE